MRNIARIRISNELLTELLKPVLGEKVEILGVKILWENDVVEFKVQSDQAWSVPEGHDSPCFDQDGWKEFLEAEKIS